MAMIDTAAKRRSASGVGRRPGGRGITPDSSKPAAWRQQVGWGYSGIAAGAAAGSADPRVLAAVSLAGLVSHAALAMTGLSSHAALTLGGLTTHPALTLEGDD